MHPRHPPAPPPSPENSLSRKELDSMDPMFYKNPKINSSPQLWIPYKSADDSVTKQKSPSDPGVFKVPAPRVR